MHGGHAWQRIRSLFRGHGEGEGAGAAAGGGAGEERADAGSSATGFISLNIFFIPVEIIVSQGYCESRDIYL